MKIAILRRLRRRYEIRYMYKGSVSDSYIIVLDHNTKMCKTYPSFQIFFGEWISDNMGMFSSINYTSRLKRREKRVEYYRQIKYSHNQYKQLIRGY